MSADLQERAEGLMVKMASITLANIFIGRVIRFGSKLGGSLGAALVTLGNETIKSTTERVKDLSAEHQALLNPPRPFKPRVISSK